MRCSGSKKPFAVADSVLIQWVGSVQLAGYRVDVCCSRTRHGAPDVVSRGFRCEVRAICRNARARLGSRKAWF